MSSRAGAVLVAAVLDAVFTEPPIAAHPVVWAGRYLDTMGRSLPAAPPGRAVAAGAGGWLPGAAASVAAGLAWTAASRRLPTSLRCVADGLALWPLLSGRLLLAEVAAVEAALQTDLDSGRAALSRIVSRDTAELTEVEVRASALESLAENLSDSVVAPLFWYAVGGLPATAAYRYANTADACWGYRTPRWLHAGRVAARADDLLNLAPARLTAALLAGRDRTVWRRLRVEAAGTPSPNSGWPMAALALRLGCRFDKRDTYVLNAGGKPPAAGDTAAALALARRAMAAAILLTTGAVAVSRPATHRSSARTAAHRPGRWRSSPASRSRPG